MRKIYLLSTLLLLTIVYGSKSYAQDFSNKGKDFWVAYGYHQVMSPGGGNGQDMRLYFAAEQATVVTVTVPGGLPTVYNVPANTVISSNIIPKSGAQDVRLTGASTAPEDKGIHITSDRPIVAYAHIYNSSVSGATILYPTNTLGKEYYSVNYTNISNSGNSNCWFYVIATDPGTTTVEITPSQSAINHPAGVTFAVTLTQGQVYNVMGDYSGSSGSDLTGSKIQSISTAGGGCKKISVFSGSGRIAISCNGTTPSSDNYMSQCMPKAAWGKKYLTTPIVSYSTINGNTNSPSTNTFYRVCVSDPTTVVRINGAVTALPLTGNFYYQINATSVPQLIEADKPITVAQYFPSQANSGCGTVAGDGDPEVIYLSPVEQSINKVLWNASAQFSITTSKHYINAIIPNGGTAISSFRLDGATVPFGSFITHPQDPAYSYIRLNVSSVTGGTGGGTGLSHIIQSDSGFNAIAYGYGPAESYGYNAGTNIIDNTTFIMSENPGGSVRGTKVCKDAPFYFSMTYPFQPTSIVWDFGGLFPTFNMPDPSLFALPPVVVGGVTLYPYKIPSSYTLSTPGTYPIKVIAGNPTPDGCGSTKEFEYTLEVFNTPVADFNVATDGCVSKPVLFTENNTSSLPITSRYWNFGDLTTSTVAVPPGHLYPLPGSYNIKYTYINDIGCIADTARKTIILDPPPTANFSIAGTYCPGSTINFTDLSTPALPTGTYTYLWDFGDATTSNLSNPTHVYANPGNYTVTLKVTSPSGCASTVFTYPTPVTINAKPVVNFNLPGVCLPTGTAQFTDGSTPGSGSISTWVWNFGDASPAVTITAPASPNVTHNYSTTGPFSVGLTVTNTNGCTDTKTQTLSTVYAEPQAAFTTAADVCLGSPSVFAETSTAPGSTVTEWTWDFGDLTPPVTIVSPGNPNISHTYAAPGSYIVKLNVKSAAGCVTVTKFAQQTVNVRSLPTASISITGAASACQNGTGPSITFTGAGGAAPYTFTYSIDDGTGAIVQPPVTTVTGNSRTITAPAGTAGTFRYALVNVAEGSTAACNQAQTGFVNVVIRPLPGGTITGTTSVCINSASPNITFTGTSGTAPYIFKYRINGGPLLTATTAVASNTVTVAVPTNVANTFVYTLESVAESSTNGCTQNITGSATVIVKQLPTATIIGSAEVCLNALTHDILFTGSNGTAPYTFSYRINGGPVLTVTSAASSNSVTVAVPTNTATTYTYTLVSVQEAGSCSQPQTGSVVTKVNPLPVADFNPSAPNCQSRSIKFNDASVPNAGTIVTWVWDFGDGSPLVTINAPASPNVTHTYANAQPYDVKLTVTTDKGCESVTTTKNIIVNINPTAAFTPPLACVADVAAKFTESSSITPGTIVAWDWLFNDPNATGANPNTSTLREPTHHFTVAGPYTVRLIVTSNTGCKDTTFRTFDVNGLPNSNFTIENIGSVCANKPVDIKDATTISYGALTKVEIFWDYLNNPTLSETDNSPSAGKLYTHLYPEFGSPATRQFRIRYVTYSGTSCVSSFSRDITLLATPMLQFDNVAGICADVPAFQVTQAQLLNTLPGIGIFTGTGISPTGLFNPASAGSGAHTIRYTYSASNGCSNYVENIIEVYPVPSINAGPDKFVLEGGQVTLSPALNASSIPVTYSWSPVTGLTDPTIAFAVSAPKDDITYILTVTSDKGCTDSDDVFVKVLKKPIVPNIFSPNGDGIHDTWKLPYIDTYPGATIDIYNRYGQLVFHSTGYAREWDGKANGKDVPVGTYYFVVDPKNGRQKMAGYVDVIR